MTIISIGASALLGILAVFLVRSMINNAETSGAAQDNAKTVQTVPIVVAAREIGFGDALKANHLKLVPWPEDSVPKGAFTSLEPFKENNKTWRSALVRMAKNEPVLAFKVSGEGQRQSLSLQIGVNMRAFAIRTNQASGVGGFILPGDSVDVVLVRKLGGEVTRTDKRVSDLIVQNVRVLGVDQNADATSEKTRVAKTVTVEVSARDAQRLALAADLGDLSLTLRRAGSETTTQARQVTIADLRGSSASHRVRRVTKIRHKAYPSTAQVAVIRPKKREMVRVLRAPDHQYDREEAKTFARLEDNLDGGLQP